ncbi:MAG TPA: DUF309 domain-containing protein [Roseiflexaceae bacterium]|nr:DUF309 domain-containing protein [Roseiflexaceae bacterium]
MYDERYRHGVELFNKQQYWLAHEAWEQCWLAAHEPDRSFYRGMIQLAAALVHWQRQNRRGVERNYAKARPHLVAVGPFMHGLNIIDLLQTMDRFVQLETPGEALPTIDLMPLSDGTGNAAGRRSHDE